MKVLRPHQDRKQAPHFGYRDGEVPEYGTCECGAVVRTDRLDLLLEHFEICPGSSAGKL